MYQDKVEKYQGDCQVRLGRHKMFHEYIQQFAKGLKGHGLDVGAGPGGCNARYFSECDSIEGCDVQQAVVDSIPAQYAHKFLYALGSKDKMPYSDESKDFVLCSCVIQHLQGLQSLQNGMKEMARVLKKNCRLYIMFKAGTNNTLLTHFNKFYGQQRTFRVFEPSYMKQLCQKIGLKVLRQDIALDENWIPYCCMIIQKQ